MDTVYLICAAVGSAVIVIQTLLLFIGVGADDADSGVDVHHADGSDIAFKALSLKTLVSFLAFFGLAGLGGQNAEVEPLPTLLMAVAAGSLAVFIVGYVMVGLGKLQSQGNLDVRNAIGTEGRVYIRVPAARSGPGKVTLLVQGRKIECKALTDGPEIPPGAQVRVVAAPAQDIVEVQLVQ